MDHRRPPLYPRTTIQAQADALEGDDTVDLSSSRGKRRCYFDTYEEGSFYFKESCCGMN